MSYANLNTPLQNLLMYNYETFMKILFLFIFFSISIYYLLYYKKKVEKPTAFWSVMILRTITTGFSFFGLALYPAILLTLDPAYTFSEFFNIYGFIYLTIFTLIMFVVLLDFSKWAFVLFLRMTGIDTNSKEYNKFKRWYKTYINPK